MPYVTNEMRYILDMRHVQAIDRSEWNANDSRAKASNDPLSISDGRAAWGLITAIRLLREPPVTMVRTQEVISI